MLTFQDLVYLTKGVEFLNSVVYSTKLGVYTIGPYGCTGVRHYIHSPAFR